MCVSGVVQREVVNMALDVLDVMRTVCPPKALVHRTTPKGIPSHSRAPPPHFRDSHTRERVDRSDRFERSDYRERGDRDDYRREHTHRRQPPALPRLEEPVKAQYVLLIPGWKTSHVIGRAGAAVRQVREETGARVQVNAEVTPSSS